MTPFKIACPDCGATLKISDPAHLGKRAKCPKCRSTLIVPDDSGEEDEEDYEVAPPPPRTSSRSSGSSRRQPAEDEFLSDYETDEFDDLPPEPRPKRKSSSSKRKKKRKSSPVNPALARAGGLAAVVLIALFIGLKVARPFLKMGNAIGWLAPAGSGIGPDLAWLPHGLDLVGEVRVSEVAKSPLVAQSLQSPQAIAGVAMMTGMFGFNLHDVESFRFGMFSAATPFETDPRLGAVIRLSKPASNIATMLESTTTATPPTATRTMHGSRSIYTAITMPTIGVCCVDDQTIVFGTINELKGVLDNNGAPESTDRFAFLDKPRQVSITIAPTNPKAASGYIGQGNLNMFQKAPMSAVSFCGDLDSVIHGALLINTNSSRAAQNAKAEFQREWPKITSGVALLGPGGPALQKSLAAAQPQVSGRLVSVTADIPGDVLTTLLASAGSSSFGPPAPVPGVSHSFPPPSGIGGQSLMPPPSAIPPAPVFSPPANRPAQGFPPATTGESSSGFGTPSATPEGPGAAAPSIPETSPFRPKSSPFRPKSPSGM